MTQLARAGVFHLGASVPLYHETSGLRCGGRESRTCPFSSSLVDVQNGAQVSPDVFHSGKEQLNIMRKSALFNHMLSPFWFQESRLVSVSRFGPKVQLEWERG